MKQNRISVSVSNLWRPFTPFMGEAQKISSFRIAATLFAILLMTSVSQALNLPRIFSDNMVLQRGIPLKIWGWADPGQSVEVSFAAQKKVANADGEGKWTVTLEPLQANAVPAELTVTAGEKHTTLKNILVGEVWICSGQSNMQWNLKDANNGQEAIAASDYPLIRQFEAKRVTSQFPQKDLQGSWAVCSPANSPNFTAVGYFFGLQLYKKLNIPIGLINTSWGGTRIEPWTDPEAIKASPELKEVSAIIANADNKHLENQKKRLDQLDAWVKQSREALERGTKLAAFPGGMPDHPLTVNTAPTSIYNAMIAPIVPYGIRGAIWYQGESNNGEGMLYFEKMKALIGSWRRIWNQGEFPFLYVQLAPYRYKKPEALPGIWEAQTAALSIPNTGMAIITDIGNVEDIHPRNKVEVGRRLALWAFAKTYGASNEEYSGPLYKSMKIKGNKIILSFDHADGLKSMDGKPLNWFTLANKDKKFVQAKAEVVGNTVVVSSEGLKKPVAVRFGWDETAEPNLINGAGLPASPFRTDK